MEIFIADTYGEMSKKALARVIELMKKRQNPVICTASGDSPAGLYKELVNHWADGEVDVSNWRFVSLDEWVGMNETDNGSCRYHLDQQLFSRLSISKDRICFFDGRAADLEGECSKVEGFIRANGGIDVAIVGIGLNGHVGMNEPGTSPELRSHVADIDPLTQQVGQKYFKEKQTLTKGLTLGIASLMDAKNVILMVSGKHKAEIMKQLINSEPSEQLPATLLKEHPSFSVFLDKDAAMLLDLKD